MPRTKQTAYCTTREAANILGVSVRTAQLWTESGLLEAWKTEGGHRRIKRSSVDKLIQGGHQLHVRRHPTVETALPRAKVLVVEDDSVLLKLYRTVLGRLSQEVEIITVGNCIDGLIRIGRDSPDLLITDLAMPGLDGIQLARSLADSPYRDGMEIVVVTGLDDAEIEAHGGLPSGIRVLRKPVPFAEIENLLGAMLKRRATYL